MVNVPFLSMNRPTGIIGVALVVISLAWMVFSMIYIIYGIGWDGSAAVGMVWLVFGIIILVMSVMSLVGGGAVTFLNHRLWKREAAGDDKDLPPPAIKYFDLNRIEGFLAVLMLSLSKVFLVNGIVFYIVNKAMWEPGNITAKRMAQNFKVGATWMFVFMFGLWIAAGICLFINKYYLMEQEDMPPKKKEGSKPKKDKPPKKKEEDKPKDKKPLPPPPPED
jgi:hypothetical protein